MPSTDRGLAGLLLLAGAGGIGYYLFRQRSQGGTAVGAPVSGAHVSVTPPEPLPRGVVQQIVATVSWTNPTAQTITYGVQGAVIQAPPIGPAGLVGGHWWATQDALQEAAAVYDPRVPQAAAAKAAIPAGRVVRQRVGPGQRGSVQLWGQPMIVLGEEWWFWIVPSPPEGLLVEDATGKHVSELPEQVVHRVGVR